MVSPSNDKRRGNARHGIEFSHVGDKVHLVWLDSADTHDELGRDVEHGEEHDWEVVGDKGGGVPVAFEEDFPGTELEEQTKDEGIRKTRASANVSQWG